MHVLGEHNGTKTEFYRTDTKSQGLLPAHFALIIIIVVHVVKHQSVFKENMLKAGEPENDAGFLIFTTNPRLVVNFFRVHTSMVSLSGC